MDEAGAGVGLVGDRVPDVVAGEVGMGGSVFLARGPAPAKAPLHLCGEAWGLCTGVEHPCPEIPLNLPKCFLSAASVPQVKPQWQRNIAEESRPRAKPSEIKFKQRIAGVHGAATTR